ncbi:MAG: tetratricopeptide repeat protein [Candidatus Hodarchaeales archaeon]
MSEELYEQVRKLIVKNNIQEAEKIYNSLNPSSKVLQNQQFFWIKLIAFEIYRSKREFKLAKESLIEIINRINLIELTPHQKRRLFGRLGTITYKIGEYHEAVSWIKKTLPLTYDDIQRYNYYLSLLLNIFVYEKNVDGFTYYFREGLKVILKNFNDQNTFSVLDFIMNLSYKVRNEPWYNIIFSELNETRKSVQSQQAKMLIEYTHAVISQKRSDYDQFHQYMNKSLEYCPKNMVNTYYYLHTLYAYLFQWFGEYQRARELLEVCLKDFPKPSKYRISLLNRLGSILRFTGDYKKAIKLLNESISLNNQYFNINWYASYSHNTLGMIYTLLGDFMAATHHYDLSKSIAEQDNDYYSLGFIYGALGWLESNQGTLSQAKLFYERSLASFEKIIDSPPSIILLAYAELLSRFRRDEFKTKQIEKLIERAKTQIWASQKRLDIGRYYNCRGYIALNYTKYAQALEEFSKALEYAESFEVKARTLLGLSQTCLELYIKTEDENLLKKTQVYLSNLRSASSASPLISVEVELILGIIDMHNSRLEEARKKFSKILHQSQERKLIYLEKKVKKQFDVLNAFQKHRNLEELVQSVEPTEFKTASVRDMISYLKELNILLQGQNNKQK